MNYYAEILNNKKEYLNSLAMGNGYYANIIREKCKAEEGEWITVKGNHILVKPGQTKEEAVKQFLEKKDKTIKIKIDFTKDNILPSIREKDAKELGIKEKPVRLKKSIIERQKNKHPETQTEAEKIISSALYSPDLKVIGKKEGYMHFIKRIEENNNSLVLIDLKESADGYYDIVHYFRVDERNRKRITKERTNAGGR